MSHAPLYRRAFLTVALSFITALSASVSYANTQNDYQDISGEKPPTLSSLLHIAPDDNANGLSTGQDDGLPLDIRNDALAEAAISLGARGGLAWRSYAIRAELESRGRYLDKVYDFRQLLIAAPSGFMIEPPIINESVNSMLIETGGQTAAVSDRIYNIINNAQIVSTPRSWRQYLERSWGSVEPPPNLLRPRDNDERETWVRNVRKGWEYGTQQADEIFEADLMRLNADFTGMVRFRVLLSQGMVSPPYALQVDRGITGGGDEMRVGDRAVHITGVPALMTRSEEWKPANR